MITADHSGIARGRFTLPSSIPAGTKTVTFIGERGSRADTEFTGRGTIEIEERRRIVTVTRYDPLAQTFTLFESRHISALGLWFAEKGTQPLSVQIRETTVGIPNQTVLARATIQAEAMHTDGHETKISFDAPVFLEANREYAIVVLTNDNTHALKIAEIGQYDRQAGKYVTEQGYAVGVLLSSSNASTWTPHNNADLTFRLYAARFTQTSHEQDLGSVELQGTTDVHALFDVERTGNETDASLLLSDEDNQTYRVQDGQSLRFLSPKSGAMKAKWHLQGSAKRSPVLYPGLFLVKGKLQEEATYISRAIASGAGKITVVLEQFSPQSASVQVEIGIDDDFQICAPQNGQPVGDGWVRNEYSRDGQVGASVRVRITLRGNSQHRPKARALRMFSV